MIEVNSMITLYQKIMIQSNTMCNIGTYTYDLYAQINVSFTILRVQFET